MGGNINGIVSMFTSGKALEGTDPLVSKVISNLSAALQQKAGFSREEAEKVSSWSIPFVSNKVKDNFNQSGKSQDLNGLAEFIGIDKNLLNLAGSPIGKLFGKFF